MKSVIVGTAGHIDHGKSALVLALTGIDPDRLKEEKARGITIDLGFAHMSLPELNVAFVDVPGHERFIKNMLAGVGGIDVVMLVVAADESVMPQTREHFDICRLLRVPLGVVALTKADLVDAETLDLVQLEVRELIAGSFLAGAPVVPVSSRTGRGLDELRGAIERVASAVHGRPTDGPSRLPIDRVFSMKGFGTIVTGTLVSGRLRVDDELLLAPGGRRVKVRGLQVHGSRRRDAVAGQRTAVNLGGIEVTELQRGQSLLEPGRFTETGLAIAALDLLPGAKPLMHGRRVRFHQGTAEILGRVSLIGPPQGTGGARPGLLPGSRGYVRLRLERPAVLVRGDRFIVRAYSPPQTIAGGSILDPLPPRTAIGTEAALERCRRLDSDLAVEGDAVEDQLRAARVMVDEAGTAGLRLTALVSRVGVAPGAIDARVAALEGRGAAVRVGEVLVAPRVLQRMKSAIVEALAQHHHAQPLSDGLSREEARVRIAGRSEPALFDRALEELASARSIVGRDRLALPTHHVELSTEAARVRETVERCFRDAALSPPDAAAVAAAAGASLAVIGQVLTLLQRQKVLVKVETLLFHDAALKRLRDEIAAIKASAGPGAKIDVQTFKERFGVTRKFAIPLLEYLDRERVTRRVTDGRIIL
jgi:selenocysteine-specific elongation factor